ncbi:MAG: S8 family serine peptidase [Flavobacteriales bacterium]|nr:S8 family serine peptidase [Flavobacteriales bacterium]
MGLRRAFLLCFGFIPVMQVVAQQVVNVQLNSGHFAVQEDFQYFDPVSNTGNFPTYCLIGFRESSPSATEQQSASYKILQYIAPGIYNARIDRPLSDEEKLELRFCSPIRPSWKKHALLDELSPDPVDSTVFVTAYFHEWDESKDLTLLSRIGATSIVPQQLTLSYRFHLPSGSLPILLSSPEIYWLEPAEFPLELNNWVERTNHRVPWVDKGAGKYQLSGKGVAVGEWDGTAADQHIDYQFRHFPQEPFSNNSNGRHATHVAGTVLGAGIKDPDAEGMAPEAILYSYDFQGPIPYEMDTSFRKFGIDLTQNSYSYGSSSDRCTVRGTYDGTSSALDALTYNYRKLLHVFAAGNSRSSNCKSGGYGTVHSGFQASKNSLVVGAVTNTDGNSSFHSYGPVRDGRLKPEVCAVGVNVYSTFPGNNYQGGYSGTSMACPGTSGTAALLYEYYRRTYKSDPPANLIKGLLCNGADELGRKGPDYQYGYGRINARRSIAILDSGHFRLQSVGASSVFSDTIFVPSGTEELKVFLCWDDPSASPSAAISLVNDLDLELYDSGGVRIRPWILNPVNYTANAVRGRDSLNNSEQITIDQPSSPYYVVRVRGTRITGSAQRFSLNWLAQEPGITVVYPNGAERWESPSSSATAQTIRWDSYGLSGTSRLEYSIDSGNTWNLIANGIASNRNYHVWSNAPSNLASHRALIRITQGGKQDQSDEVFHIFRKGPTPTAVRCDGQLHLKWAAQPGAQQYAVYMHDSGRMKLQGITRNPFFTLRGLDNSTEYWVAVSSIDANGAEGPRSDGVPFTPRAGFMPPRIAQQPQDIRICSGVDTSFRAAVLGDSPLRLFWDQSTDQGTSWTSMGVNTANLDVKKPRLEQNATLFRIKAVNACEDTVYSRSALLQVDSAIRFSYSDTRIALCIAQDTQIRLQFQASNEPQFQWFFQKTLSSNPSFLNGFKDVLSIRQANESKEGYYFAQIRNVCGTYIGQQIPFVEVHPQLRVEVDALDTVCVGRSVSMFAKGSGGDSSRYAFSWRNGATLVSGRSFIYNPAKDDTWTISLFDNCSADTQFAVRTIRMRDTLKVDLGPNRTICLGESVTLDAKPSGGRAESYTFSWGDVADPGSQRTISPSQTTNYRIILSDGCTVEDAIDEILITVLPALQVQIQSERDTQCFGQATQLQALLSGGRTNTYSVLWNDGDTSQVRTVSPTNSLGYGVVLRDGCTVEDATDSFYLPVRAPLVLNAWNSDPTICYGVDTLIGVDYSGGDPARRVLLWSDGTSRSDRIRVKPLQTTTYTVSLSDGCSSPADMAQIEVEVLAPLKLTLQDVRKCAADTLDVLLNAEGGRTSTYRFLLNGAALQGNSFRAGEPLTANYNVRLTDGCSIFDDSSSMDVFVNPLERSAFDLVRRNGKTVQLSCETSPNSITWLLGDGYSSNANSDGLVHTYENYGLYRICRVEWDDFGCSDTFCQRINVYDPFSTDNFDLQVYPNPVGEMLYIETDRIAGDLRIEFIDASGRTVWNESRTNLEFTKFAVDMSSFANGMYLLRLYANGEMHIRRFQKI